MLPRILGSLNSPKTPEMSALVGGNGANSCHSLVLADLLLRMQNAGLLAKPSLSNPFPIHPSSLIPHPFLNTAAFMRSRTLLMERLELRKTRAQLRPGMPEMEPPGWVPAPVR